MLQKLELHKYCDNARKFCTRRWTHFSSIASILLSITTILSEYCHNTCKYWACEYTQSLNLWCWHPFSHYFLSKSLLLRDKVQQGFGMKYKKGQMKIPNITLIVESIRPYSPLLQALIIYATSLFKFTKLKMQPSPKILLLLCLASLPVDTLTSPAPLLIYKFVTTCCT